MESLVSHFTLSKPALSAHSIFIFIIFLNPQQPLPLCYVHIWSPLHAFMAFIFLHLILHISFHICTCMYYSPDTLPYTDNVTILNPLPRPRRHRSGRLMEEHETNKLFTLIPHRSYFAAACFCCFNQFKINDFDIFMYKHITKGRKKSKKKSGRLNE